MSEIAKPKINVKGGIQDLKKKERKINPDRVRTSAFFLSINTNQPYKPNVNDQHLQNDSEIFEEVMVDILNHIDNYIIIPASIINVVGPIILVISGLISTVACAE